MFQRTSNICAVGNTGNIKSVW